MPFRAHLTLRHLPERAGVDPDAPAVVFEGAEQTYRQLNRRAARVAGALRGLGVRSGDRVGVVLGNCLEFWETNFGIWRTGGIVVPINTRLSPAEVANLLQRSGAQVVLHDSEHAEHVAGAQLPHQVLIGEGVVAGALDYEELLAAAPDYGGPAERDPADPAEIIYTSGTTGLPKGAVWTHESVLWNSIQQCMDYRLGPDDSAYVAVGSYYIGGRHDFVIPLLHSGGAVHLRRLGGFDGEQIARYLQDQQITVMLLVPTMLHDVVRHPNIGHYDLSSVRMVMVGGAPVAPALLEDAMKVFPNAGIIQVYGSTEAGGTVTQLTKADSVRKIGSCGKATVHNVLKVVGPDGAELPPGEVGDLLVQGPSVIAGYWENLEATEAALAGGWLHTGDLARTDEEGYLYIVGRAKDMIISGGLNIYPEEVEGVLRAQPGVDDVAVIGLPDERWGESVCAVVQCSGQRPDTEALIADVRDTLASYKKPKRVEYVDELPRTATGKVRKHVLRDQFASVPASSPVGG